MNAQAQTSIPIHYNLPSAGKVSLGIYNSSGRLIRTVHAAAEQTAGAKVYNWNGLDDKGVAVPSASTCTWKMLKTNGLQADFQMMIGASFPYGSEEWHYGLGNHDGPRSVASDGTHLYAAAGVSENTTTRNAIKMTLSGTHVWSGAVPEAWKGRFAMAVMDGNLYHLRQDGDVAFQGVNQPNHMNYNVGNPSAPQNIGTGWSAKWTGETLTTNGWGLQANAQSMDMTARRATRPDGTSVAQVVVSYRNFDAVRWYHPTTGAILATATNVTEPTGVAIDNQANVLVLSDNQLWKVQQNGSKTSVISGLDQPFRVDVATNGDIYIAEHGANHHVKHYNSAYVLQNTNGVKKRADGLYVRTNFKDVVDIAADNAGGFVVAEHGAPRRVARFSNDGTWIKEWTTAHWIPTASPDPTNPNVIWATITGQEMARLTLNYATKTWNIHSIYYYVGLADGLIGQGYEEHNESLGGGYFDWHVRKRGSTTYLIRRKRLEVIKVDETNWKLIPVVAAKWSATAGNTFLWTDDVIHDGKVQATEKKTFGTFKENSWNVAFLDAPIGFDYYRYSGDLGKIIKHPVLSWNANGVPIYKPLDQGEEFASLPYRDGHDNYYANPTGAFAKETEDGPLYMTYNAPASEWGRPPYTRMYKFDNTGTFEWETGKHLDRPYGSNPKPKPPAGSVYSYKNNVGVARGVVVGADYDGGSGGVHALTYAWDQDGLYVGNLFENFNTASAPEWAYGHSRDNGAGTMYTYPGGNGDVLYFAGAENEVRVYKITGWNNWVRQNGPVNNAPGNTLANGTYKIVAKHSGKALDVQNASTSNMAIVQQWDYAGSTNQQWQVTALGGGYYKVIAAHSTKSLDVVANSLDDGAAVKQYTYAGNTNQQFQIQDVGGGYYRMVAGQSGRSLEITGASTANGGTLQQAEYTGADNQKWQFLSPSISTPLADGTYKIIARHSGKGLDVDNLSTADGAVVHQWTYVAAQNQKWNVVSVGGGYYKIEAVHSGKVLDVISASTANGAPVKQYGYLGNPNQQFEIESVGGGYYKIVPRHSGKALQIFSEATTNGADLEQWDYTGATNQQWQFLAP
jgi:hypothetical protein